MLNNVFIKFEYTVYISTLKFYTMKLIEIENVTLILS